MPVSMKLAPEAFSSKTPYFAQPSCQRARGHFSRREKLRSFAKAGMPKDGSAVIVEYARRIYVFQSEE
jgi:hypothetical protein